MRLGLIIGFICSVVFNIAAFGGFAWAFRPKAPAPPAERVVEVIFEEETIVPPPPQEVTQVEVAEGTSEASDEPVASLPDPPPSVVVDGAITEVYRPTPPVPPRPDGLARAFAPVQRGTAAGTGGTGLGASIFSIMDLDRQPQVRVRPTPIYPFELRRQGIRGNAVVRIELNEQGTVDNVQVMSASHPDFGKAAADAARRVTMTPGTKNGRPVRFFFDLPYAFNLDTR